MKGSRVKFEKSSCPDGQNKEMKFICFFLRFGDEMKGACNAGEGWAIISAHGRKASVPCRAHQERSDGS